MRIFKKVIFILAIIFAIASLFALFIPYFIDLTRYKPQIQEFVTKKIDAKIDYTSARLNFWGGLGIKLKDVALINTEAPFKDTKLFTAEDLDIRFNFIPLFSKKLIGTVYIETPTVNIIKIGAKNNLESLKNTSKNAANATAESKPTQESNFKVILNEFSVSNANILYQDLTTPAAPTKIDIKDININMIREGEIFNIEKLTMTLFSGQLNSKIKIDTSTPQISYDGSCSIKDLSLSDIYHSFGGKKRVSPLQGEGDINFTFNGKGTTKPEYSKSLNAKGTFNINHGQLKIDTALPIILDQLGQFLMSFTLPNFNLGITRDDLKKAVSDTQTIILDGVKGDFTIKNGVLLVKNNIPMKQGDLTLDLSIGIFTSKLNGVAIFRATEAFTKSLVASNKNFALLLDKQNRFVLRIYLSGTVDNPQIAVDTKEIMQNILSHTTKSILNPMDTIKDTLKKIFPF